MESALPCGVSSAIRMPASIWARAAGARMLDGPRAIASIGGKLALAA
jgi:hypothetical protein